ncbi:hypothetical protein FRB95_009339 [Tulasnella sp. JGI-2019a]|nr:hypothetical protein FRB93_005873 [Tulasnella sp. JGI-2019a]KAG9026168.1 hypothetical protein FRB95_009339 [Tulasnella sp. JGI-2019a]
MAHATVAEAITVEPEQLTMSIDTEEVVPPAVEDIGFAMHVVAVGANVITMGLHTIPAISPPSVGDIVFDDVALPVVPIEGDDDMLSDDEEDETDRGHRYNFVDEDDMDGLEIGSTSVL